MMPQPAVCSAPVGTGRRWSHPQDAMENYEEVDDSRPFFQRQPCEIGLYLSVYSAEPLNEEDVGLEHFFLMKTTETLYEELKQLDVVYIRAEFARRRLFTDMYIERFEPGIVMAVGFDSMDSLNSLWKMHKDHTLTPLLQEILVSNDMLEKARVKRVDLVTKLWEDEFECCKRELTTKHAETVNIRTKDGDMAMVQRLKAYQVYLGEEVTKMRDQENEMETCRKTFEQIVQSIIPVDKTEINSLHEFETFTKADSVSKMYFKNILYNYLAIIEQWRDYFRRFEVEIVTPLLQIHRVCETARQHEIKEKIIQLIHEMQDMLRPGHSLRSVVHPDMATKVLKRDHPLYLGLLSLVPMGAERVTDIDILIDEYMRDFKFEVPV